MPVPEHSATRSTNLKRLAGPLVVIALIAGIVWYTTGGGSGGWRHRGRTPLIAWSVRPTGPRLTTAASAAPLGAPPAAPDPAGPFEFVRTQPDSERQWRGIRADRCRYVVNPDRRTIEGSEAPPRGRHRTNGRGDRASHSHRVGTTDEEWSKEREPLPTRTATATGGRRR